MELSSRRLRRELHDAGFANAAINAVWPQWWSAEAELSTAAQSELLFTVARRLGLTATSVMEGAPQFTWVDETKFKNLSTVGEREQLILSGFGSAVARALTALVPEGRDIRGLTAQELRATLLRNYQVVGLRELLTFCWSVGIPLVQLHVFPLTSKRMHAMASSARGRSAILLGARHTFPARYAHIVAHELGHIALGHLGEDGNLIDIVDPLLMADADDEERQADCFALELLTGESDPQVLADRDDFSATQLADAASRLGPQHGIEPGVLALLLGHRTQRWRQTMGALKIIPPGTQRPWEVMNELAAQQLRLDDAPPYVQEHLRALLGLSDAASG